MDKISPHIKRYKDIETEFKFTFRQIEEVSNRFIRRVNKGTLIREKNNPFAFCTPSEIREIKGLIQLELERKYCLELIAAYEAKLVYYFRHKLKRNHALHSIYVSKTTANERRGMKPLMFRHIAGISKEAVKPLNNMVYANFINLIEYRNWLAHGREWPLENHLNKFDFNNTYNTLSKLTSYFPNYPMQLH
jgi:hypothetical protein